jgi:16S rRNA (uracil1498-N3)-methyltransferase
MHVFFQPDLSSETIQLSEEESKHCVRVIRLKTGDEVHLADGKGTHALAKISDDNPKKCILNITSRTQFESRQTIGKPFYLHIIVAPTKNFDRMEWFIEKAVESGIDEITFIETTNSERAKINMDRCHKIAISAMKQSKQWFLPRINPLVNIHKLFEQHAFNNKTSFIAWCESEYTELLSIHLRNTEVVNPKVTVLVGPEGDFTATEIQLAKQAGMIPVSLGENILRTETAALYACMSVKALLS